MNVTFAHYSFGGGELIAASLMFLAELLILWGLFHEKSFSTFPAVVIGIFMGVGIAVVLMAAHDHYLVPQARRQLSQQHFRVVSVDVVGDSAIVALPDCTIAVNIRQIGGTYRVVSWNSSGFLEPRTAKYAAANFCRD